MTALVRFPPFRTLLLQRQLLGAKEALNKYLECRLSAKQWQYLVDNTVLPVLRAVVVKRARCQVHRL